MGKALNYYNDNIKSVKEKLAKLEKNLLVFSTLRFMIVILCIGMMYYFYKQNSMEAVGGSFLISLILFIIVAFFHNERINSKKRLLVILEYNEKGLKRLDNTWKEFSDRNHKFSSDLDIFGKNSLFQWINLTKTTFGRKKLASKMIMNSLPTRYEIEEEQEAIKELANKREFCEKIYFEASIESKKKEKLKELLDWASNEEKNNFTVKYISYIFIAITCIILFLTIIGRLSISYLILDLVINYLVIKLFTKKLSDVIDIFINNKREIEKYSAFNYTR